RRKSSSSPSAMEISNGFIGSVMALYPWFAVCVTLASLDRRSNWPQLGGRGMSVGIRGAIDQGRDGRRQGRAADDD
ncbi:MAG: hypothetical protein VCE75_09335, partial [Alphaproteobacteria bacterium]